jgi:hypothetical protein
LPTRHVEVIFLITFEFPCDFLSESGGFASRVLDLIHVGQPFTAVDANFADANWKRARGSWVADAFGNPVKMDVFSVAVKRPVRKCRG